MSIYLYIWIPPLTSKDNNNIVLMTVTTFLSEIVKELLLNTGLKIFLVKLKLFSLKA